MEKPVPLWQPEGRSFSEQKSDGAASSLNFLNGAPSNGPGNGGLFSHLLKHAEPSPTPGCLLSTLHWWNSLRPAPPSLPPPSPTLCTPPGLCLHVTASQRPSLIARPKEVSGGPALHCLIRNTHRHLWSAQFHVCLIAFVSRPPHGHLKQSSTPRALGKYLLIVCKHLLKDCLEEIRVHPALAG